MATCHISNGQIWSGEPMELSHIHPREIHESVFPSLLSDSDMTSSSFFPLMDTDTTAKRKYFGEDANGNTPCDSTRVPISDACHAAFPSSTAPYAALPSYGIDKGRPPVGGMHRSVSLDGPVPLISADNHTGGEAPLHHYNMYPSTKQYVSYAPTIGGDNNVMKGTMMTGTTPLVNLADRAGCNTRVYHVRKGHLYDAKHDVSSMSLIYNPATTSQGTQNLHAGTTLTNESAAPCSNIYGRFTGGLLGGITESSGISPTPDASKTAKQPKRKRSAVGKKNKANATQPQMQPSPKKVARRSKSTKVSVRANIGHAKLAAPKKSLLQKKSKKQTPAAKTLPHKTTGGKAPITSATDRCLSTPTFPYSLQPTPEGTNFNPPTLSGEASSPFQLAPYSGAYGMVPPADTPHVDVLRSTSTSSPRNILPQIHSPMHVELVHGASRGNTADSLLYASTAATSLASTVSKYTVDVASSQMDSANTMTGVMRPEHTATFSFVNTLPLPPHRVHEAATARSPWENVTRLEHSVTSESMESNKGHSRTSSPDSGVSTTLVSDVRDVGGNIGAELDANSDDDDSVDDLDFDDGDLDDVSFESSDSGELMKLLGDSVGSHGKAKTRKGSVIQPQFTAKQESALRRQLEAQLQSLDNRQNEPRGLSASEKKKLRNRKASRVSRLKKKLYVFELQRSYVAVLKEKKKQEAELEALQAALRETTAAVLKYDKSFVCSIKGTGTEM